jgi:hypothetical protein
MLGSAFAEVRQIDQARRCIGEATTIAETSGERWFDAEIYRMAGEIELLYPSTKRPMHRAILNGHWASPARNRLALGSFAQR